MGDDGLDRPAVLALELLDDAQPLFDLFRVLRGGGPAVLEADERIGRVLEKDGRVLEARPELAEGRVVGGQVAEDGLEPGQPGDERVLAEVGQVEGLVDEAGDLLGVPEDLPFAEERLVLAGPERGRLDLLELVGDEVEPLLALLLPGLEVALFLEQAPELLGGPGRVPDEAGALRASRRGRRDGSRDGGGRRGRSGRRCR